MLILIKNQHARVTGSSSWQFVFMPNLIYITNKTALMSICMQLRNMYALQSSAYGLQWLGVHSLPRAMINAQTLWEDQHGVPICNLKRGNLVLLGIVKEVIETSYFSLDLPHRPKILRHSRSCADTNLSNQTMILCKNKREQSLSMYFVHAYKNMGLF